MTNEPQLAEIDRTVVDDALPRVAGLAVDTLHVAGTRRNVYGSSWYDAFAIAPDRLVVAVGDVAGRESRTGELIAQLRQSFENGDPTRAAGAVLRAADELIRCGFEVEGASALVGIIDLSRHAFTYTGAGHVPPFLRYADGSVRELPLPGPAAVGAAAADRPPVFSEVDLAGGSLLVLFTHGLVRAAVDIAAGLHRLHYVLGDDRLAHSASPAAWLARRMLDDATPGDVSLIAAALPRVAVPERGGETPRWVVNWSFDATAAAATEARRAYIAALASKAESGAVVDLAAAELIFGEMLGNVVRHAPGWVDVSLEWTGEHPVLQVDDNGPGFHSRRRRERLPDDELSESGRGLFIIHALAVDFAVTNRAVRGTRARATLPLEPPTGSAA
jgi:anti-sigma regulatory factor (Ser/Thr protein kinase)